MSFILDAIARSEQERQQQQTPDARSLAFPTAAPARPRKTAPVVLTVLLLLGSAILAVVWIQSQRLQVTPRAEPGGSAMPAAPEAAGQPPAPAETRDAPPAETPKPAAATRMLADSSAAETAIPAAPAAAAKKPAAPAADSLITAANENAAGDSLQASLETESGTSGAVPAAAGETPPTVTVMPRRKISRLSDLPADVRSVLPSVVFTGHLYSRNPKASYVFIDGGRQVVVGQQISDGLVLDEITPTGVVVEFQGYLIEVGVLQNWSLK